MVQYKPLDPQKSEIRLVTLLPGKPRDAIRCTLSTASLDNPPKFAALSYAWGDPSETKPIILDSEPFEVTVNLEAGLRVIRKRWRRRMLWIDAICINQKDVQEKNVQVPQMGRLYSTAPTVLAWLGPSNPNIELFVSWMQAHTTRSHITASAHWLALDARSALSKSAKRDRDWAILGAYEGYHDFLALSYWGRVWTFQEYRLPRIAPVCLCGNIRPFQLATVLGRLDFETFHTVCNQAMRRLAAEIWKMKGEERAAVLEAYQRVTTKTHPEKASAVLILPGLRGYDENSLAILLYMTVPRQCFDERDKIYGLYGMIPTAQDLYPPDYTKPITEVMLQAAAYMVNFEHSSDLWTLFGLRQERLSDSRLYPSWMPDFSSIESLLINVDRKGGVAMPLRGSEHRPAYVSVEHTTVRLWARCLGTCKVVFHFADTEPDILEQIKGLLQMDVLKDGMGKKPRKPETLTYRIARACVTHHVISPKFSTTEILETLYLAYNSDPYALQNSSREPCWRMIQVAAKRLEGKALLVTEDGCFGISVAGARDGDIVVIPPDVGAPLVLTPESSTATDGVKYYKMVGTALIDGVMRRGELCDEELVEEIAKRDVVEFLIH